MGEGESRETAFGPEPPFAEMLDVVTADARFRWMEQGITWRLCYDRLRVLHGRDRYSVVRAAYVEFHVLPPFKHARDVP